MSKQMKDAECLLFILLNHSRTADIFRQRFTPVADTVFCTIFSRICLLALPISLFAGLISLHLGELLKLGLWSFRVINDSRSAMVSILSSSSSSVAIFFASLLILLICLFEDFLYMYIIV